MMNKKSASKKLIIPKEKLPEISLCEGEDEISSFIKRLELQNIIIDKILEPIIPKSEDRIIPIPESNNPNP